jgi:hypothetical protein
MTLGIIVSFGARPPHQPRAQYQKTWAMSHRPSLLVQVFWYKPKSGGCPDIGLSFRIVSEKTGGFCQNRGFSGILDLGGRGPEKAARGRT